MLEIIIIILIIYFIYIFFWSVNKITLPFKKYQEDELKKINSKIDLISHHIHFNDLYDNSYYIKTLFKHRKELEDLEHKVAFNPEYDEETYYIKNINQLSLSGDFISINLLYFRISYYSKITEYIKDLEIKTLLGSIEYENGKKKYKKYIDKAPTDFNCEKDFNDYSENIERTLNRYEDLIKYKWFDKEEIRKDLLNKETLRILGVWCY